MQLTVLGKSPSWQDAGGACSGYLVEADGACVLLDCGSGVLGKLRSVRDYRAVDAVVISHLHGDHILDLVPYASALTYGPRTGAGPRLLAPPGAQEAFRRLAGAAGMNEEHIERAFGFEEYDPSRTVEVGTLQLRFRPVRHFMPTHAIDVAGDGARLTYSADTAPTDALCDLARDTDLLLVEATVPVPEQDEPRGHMTPAEAGESARRAGAQRVVLTHMTDEGDAELARREAEAAFGGPVELAHDGAVYDL